jgi:hypothetical protein
VIRPRLVLALASLALFIPAAIVAAAPPNRTPTVVDRSQAAIRSLGPRGQSVTRPSGGTAARRALSADPTQPSPRAASTPAPCALATGPALPGVIQRESRYPGFAVDACGQLRVDAGYMGPIPAPWPGRSGAALAWAASMSATIDSMTTGNFYGDTYQPFTGIDMLGGARTYYLSDGSQWGSGAGSYRLTLGRYLRVETVGTTLRYVLNPPPDSVLYEQTDYDGGDHSAQGVLKVAGPLVLEATAGSNTAVMSGLALVASNDATWYGEPRFNFYSALAGSVVPFVIRYTLSSGAWSATTMEGFFSYSSTGSVDFAHPVSSPGLASVEIVGPGQVPDRSTAQFSALAHFDGGVERDVTAAAHWTVSPAALASVDAGQLVTQALTTPRADLDLRASYTFGGVTREAQLTVVCRGDLLTTSTSAWPTYQANARHDGYLPLSLRTADFNKVWSVAVGNGAPLNPVTAADGRVFCSTYSYFGSGDSFFALDARDGHVMWSKAYSAFSINPPGCAYGNAYIQTCNHASDTWLHAYDAATGRVIFNAPHAAQWERYYAPTPFDGKMYVDGGYYGGMYAFDALSGSQQWFLDLPQYDEWTPAVDSSFVYAYLGEYNPGLYVARREDAAQIFMIPDSHFEWDGWSMNLAPTLGAHGEVVAIHDGRLIHFNLATRTIDWELARSFQGQPSVAHDLIYAIDGRGMVALDEVTGVQRWSWTPSGFGGLSGTMIVTDTHLFASSADSVFALDLASHQRVWSYPAAGALALGNGQLYVAASSGMLTAIATENARPVVHASAGRDTTVACAPDVSGGTPVRLDGRGSIPAGVAFDWSAPGVAFDDPHSATPTGGFSLGTTTVVLTVSLGGESARDSVLVTVTDATAPSLAVTLNPTLLWPPDHRMVPVHATVSASDACDPNPAIHLVSVDCSEPDPASFDGADLGAADFDLRLKSERSGGAPGRVYTICYEAVDAAGNRAQRCENVVVPHDQSQTGRGRYHDAGPGLSLTLYGSPTLVARSIVPPSITVETGETSLLRVPNQVPAFRDEDGDGFEDAVFTLGGAGTAPIATPASEVILWARWRAANKDYLSALSRDGVAGVNRGGGAMFTAGVSPNPAARLASLRYTLPHAGHVRLSVFDVSGRWTATLVNGNLPAGDHAVAFDGAGRHSTQLYLYRLEWEGRVLTGKFMLVE